MSTFKSLGKTLALAALTATTIGIGAAMAQEGGPSMPGNDFGAAGNSAWGVHQPIYRQSMAPSTAVQAGSSDVNNPWAGSGAKTDSSWYIGGGEN
jgi:hypothetical protein